MKNGIWYGNTGTRASEIPLIEAAARNLGYAVSVVEDPVQAHEVVLEMSTRSLEARYPDAKESQIGDLAAHEADVFVQDMEPSPNNSQDPVRLVGVEDPNGEAVKPYEIAEEIKFRVAPSLARTAITADEVLYGAQHPVNPHVLLD